MAGLFWKIQGEEKRKYDNIFDSLGPTAGKLSGDKVKPILLNSKLPTDILGQVWELSDIDKDGHLDKDEFCVAMHLVYKALEHEPVPSVLPQDVIPPSKRKPALIGAVSVLPPLTSAINSDLKKSALSATTPATVSIASPASGGTLTPSVNAQQTMSSSIYIKSTVPDVEFNRFSGLFAQKSAPDGYIAGSDARDLFVQSRLPQPVLAHVWNLCDQQQLGKLNQDQFILAMHFIAQKVKGVDVPAQLPPEVLSPKARDSGFSDSGNLSDSSSSGVGDFSAVRELDALNREIEDLRKEKETLTVEIREKEMTVRIKNNEVQELQNTLDRASTSLSQLESDKAEAHTKIDELDQQQLKLDGMIADVRAKVHEETETIAALKSQITAQEMANKQQEEEYAKVKKELESLELEEMQLQQTLEVGQQQLSNITKQVVERQKEIENVKERILPLVEQQKTVSSNIEQYDKAVMALKSEADATNDMFSEFDVPNKLSTPKDDPFTLSDPFAPKSEFSNDPFADSSTFDTAQSKNDFSSGDVSGVFSSLSIKDSEDPFSSTNDPFAAPGSAFQTSAFDKDPFGGSDPFSSASTTSPKKENSKSTDLFSVGFNDPNPSASLFNDSEKVTTKTNDSDDPWAAFGGVSASDNDVSSTADFFGKDSFSPNPTASFGAFDNSFAAANNSNNKISSKDNKGNSEKAQMAWAEEEGKKELEEREKRKIQEQLDLEYAIKLSKEM